MSEWYGTLPERWETHRIKTIFQLRDERNFLPLSEVNLLSLYTAIGVKPHFQIERVAGNVAVTADNYKKVYKNDMVVNIILCWQGAIGVSKWDGVTSPAYDVYRVISDSVNVDYYHYLFRLPRFNGECYRAGHGIMAMRWRTYSSEFGAICVPLPPRAEQDQIVRFLDWKVSRINKLINAKKQQIGLLQEQKQVSINKTLSDINTNSNVVLCRHLGSFQNGISEAGDFFTEGFPFVNYGDVYNNEMLPEGVSGRAKSNEKQQATYSVEQGDIFFTRTSETIDEVGLTSVCFKTIDKAVFSGFIIRMRPKQNILNNEYAKYFFRSKSVRNYFVKEMNIVTRASLGQTLLKNLPVVLPDTNTQKMIAMKLGSFCNKSDKLITAIKTEIKLLHEYRTRLISDVVTGKLDVRNVVVPEYEAVEEAAEDELPMDAENFAEDDNE